MKKKNVSILLITLITALTVFGSCLFEAPQPAASAGSSYRSSHNENLERNFADDTVIVMLTKEVSIDFFKSS